MKTFYIGGTICGNENDKVAFEDVTPAQIMSVIKKLDDGEALEVQICSMGGDVFGGLQIYNALRNASKSGHKIITHCTSLAASIASIIFMAGDEMIMDSNSFLCIHLPWTMITGNAEDMRKEADTLDKLRDKMVEIYQTKMNLPKDKIVELLKTETWISASEINDYNLNCSINQVQEFKIAASISKNIKNFNKVPLIVKDLIMENEIKEEVKEEVKEVVEQTEIKDEVKEEVKDATEVTETKEEVKEEIKDEVKEEKEEAKVEMIAKAEADKRVSGMQSTMAKKLDALRLDYENKISEFQNQIKAKDEELTTVKAEVTNLTQKLEESSKELKNALSALDEKKTALATLNAGVLTPKMNVVDWRSLKGKEFLDYVKNHPEIQK